MISPELIVRASEGEIAILVASEGLTVIRGRCAPGVQIAGRHTHLEHTDAFYVLEGELTFELGPEAEAVTVGAGGFVAIPPGVAHALRNASDGFAASLSIHAPDGGFAAFMRGRRDGVDVDWDIADVPPDGGLPAAEAVVRSGPPR